MWSNWRLTHGVINIDMWCNKILTCGVKNIDTWCNKIWAWMPRQPVAMWMTCQLLAWMTCQKPTWMGHVDPEIPWWKFFHHRKKTVLWCVWTFRHGNTNLMLVLWQSEIHYKFITELSLWRIWSLQWRKPFEVTISTSDYISDKNIFHITNVSDYISDKIIFDVTNVYVFFLCFLRSVYL